MVDEDPEFLSRKAIRAIAVEATINHYQIVITAEDMAEILMERCDPADPCYQRAAECLIAFQEGKAEGETAREAFIDALESAGIFYRDE